LLSAPNGGFGGFGVFWSAGRGFGFFCFDCGESAVYRPPGGARSWVWEMRGGGEEGKKSVWESNP
jgi:hypothetical protein